LIVCTVHWHALPGIGRSWGSAGCLHKQPAAAASNRSDGDR
jgi:hypothetical protein